MDTRHRDSDYFVFIAAGAGVCQKLSKKRKKASRKALYNPDEIRGAR
jgi:hypothetical protein